jgi:hypothetical protein
VAAIKLAAIGLLRCRCWSLKSIWGAAIGLLRCRYWSLTSIGCNWAFALPLLVLKIDWL